MSHESATTMLDSPQPGVTPAPTRPSGQILEPSRPHTDAAQTPGPSRRRRESHRARSGRNAHRIRLYVYALGALAVLVYVVALATSNTHHVRVHWLFGSSSPSLVWLVLSAAILGWLLGILITALFRWRTRAPRPS
jgi:uncharacterized integral membrane protein